MPKTISAAATPEFESDIVVPAPGDGASSAVVETAIQRLLNNAEFVRQASEALGNGLASHLAQTDPHQATSAATAERLVLRDSEGRARFGAPSDPADAARLADIGGALGTLPAVLRDASAWEGFAGAFLAVNEDEDGLEARNISSIFGNENGTSFRFGRSGAGMQVCIHGFALPGSGSGSRSAVWEFPQAFAARPRVLAMAAYSRGDTINVGGESSATVTQVEIGATITNTSAGNRFVDAIAVGPF